MHRGRFPAPVFGAVILLTTFGLTGCGAFGRNAETDANRQACKELAALATDSRLKSAEDPQSWGPVLDEWQEQQAIGIRTDTEFGTFLVTSSSKWIKSYQEGTLDELVEGLDPALPQDGSIAQVCGDLGIDTL